MNLLEHEILKIKNVEDISENPRVKEIYGNQRVYRVILLVDCYGSKEECSNIWTQDEWKKIKKQGYFLA